ncbi:hypothetical protein AMTR_s00045p00181910 [Amborella trichopoda]|uniref:Beta-carotene isomerase D27-like C-terminal domain-containing protein n=2 Tax=Amborella trichopoda TaxID=13333 RepID=W1P3C6_AMBTC|nr:hypothetical protein AMTR_s00045p00181910 [Amborella trichopoda]
MEVIATHPLNFHVHSHLQHRINPLFNPNFRIRLSPIRSKSINDSVSVSSVAYKPGLLDDVFLQLFRNKMVQEVGWDSEKPGYDGLIEVARRIMRNGQNNVQVKQSVVRILRSLFPPFLLELFQLLIAPIAGGKLAAMMIARVTTLTCQWLMGRCTINSIELPDGSSCSSGVLVERCKYLEESRCAGICINTCKLPTQTFIKEYMGTPLLMEPNLSDYSCQFKFGVPAPPPENDEVLKAPCLDICPEASGQKRRKNENANPTPTQCPKT